MARTCMKCEGPMVKHFRHRLMCADSSNESNLDKLMAGAKADMVYADPPYGMRLNTNYLKASNKSNLHTKGNRGRNYEPVIGDDQDYDPRLLLEYFAEAKEVFLWGADYYCQHIPKEGSWVVWDKRSKADGTTVGDNFHGAHFELLWSKVKHQREICRILWFGLCQGPKEGARVHPTQKPVMLTEWVFERWGSAGDLVVDLYGGSGSTLLACDRQQRMCRMMELYPAYCDVIIARWEKLTGQKAERISGESEAA